MNNSAAIQSHPMQDIIAGFVLVAALLIVVIADRILGPSGAEVVFLIDQRPVMKSLRAAIRDRCLETAKSLHAQGKEYRFAVIPFGGHRSHLPLVALTGDPDVFRNQVQGDPGDAAPFDGTAISAMNRALKWNFRKGEPVIFYLISAMPFENTEEVRVMADQLSDRGIGVFIQSGEDAQLACKPLLSVGGRFVTFEGKEIKSSTASTKSGNRAASLVASLSNQKGIPIPQDGLYSARTSADRKKIVIERGGTEESEAAVAAGLDWLARHQADDGHWSDHGKCETDACPPQDFVYQSSYAPNAQLAETGLAILAMQAGGFFDFNGELKPTNGSAKERQIAIRYSETVRRGLDWLVEQQADDGSWFGKDHGHHATWYQHGIVTFAMAEACAVARENLHEPNRRYLYAAERAIKFLEDHQYTKGGWQYAPSDGVGDTSVSGWQMLALKSALMAEIPISQETLDRCHAFFERCGDATTGQTGYQSSGGGSELTTSVGLIVQHLIAETPDSVLAIKATEYLASRAKLGLAQRGDFYTLYNGTLGMFLSGGEKWTTWNDLVRDEIIKKQDHTGCARGSWDGPGKIGEYGRTLDTAWAILTLEVYIRYSPQKLVPKGKIKSAAGVAQGRP